MSNESAVLFHDDFSDGFDTSSRWQLLAVPSVFVADDGVAERVDGGVRIRASGTNPSTGLPAFAKARSDGLGHLKWMASPQSTSGAGFPGFDVPPGRVLRYTVQASSETHGTSEHPFGDAVADPDTDLRLAASIVNLMDYESGVVLDFWVTNRAVYPFYERFAPPGSEATYQTFTSVFGEIPREPSQRHEFELAFDESAGRASWVLDGQEVGAVSDLGRPSPDARFLVDHGGEPSGATPRQWLPGIALMTYLDGDLLGTGEGLVPLEMPYASPQRFRGGPALFGQGAEITVRSAQVRTA